MQVTQAQDHVTHAVIGGNQAIAFGISDSPEFFQILSSTLYSDQILAVVREVLCNAWDAHIASGRTDIAVQVTLDSTKLTIRDFGAGIHRDMMGPIYGTYGNSTKTNDGAQTGGFGLGCKAPFAYTDHFEVVSHHEGVRTIYALSKSSAEKLGKPGITPIASFPTTQSGLLVSIPLKTPNDERRFKELLIRTARNGEMRVEVNGEPVQGLPFSKCESNWLITSSPLLDTNHKILVRYGNVLYPVERTKPFFGDYDDITRFLQSLMTSYSHNYRIVFQAPPHSISVTPSRESLSMQEHTIRTLTTLLASFLPGIHGRIATEAHQLLDRQIQLVTAQGRVGELLHAGKNIPGMEFLTPGGDLKHIGTLAELTVQYTRTSYPKEPKFYRRDMSLRLDAAMQLKVGRRGHLMQVKRAISGSAKKTHQKKSLTAFDWYKRRIVRPLVRDLAAHPMMDPKQMFVFNPKSAYDTSGMVAVQQCFAPTYGEYLPLLRNILVLTHSRKELLGRIAKFPEMKKLGSVKGVFIYVAPVAKTRLQAMRDFFLQRGFTLLDMTVPQAWDPPKPVKAPIDPTRVKKPKPTGYPALAGVKHPGLTDRVDNCFLEGAPRIEKPLFYLQVMYSRAEFRLFTLGGTFSTGASLIITRIFGNDCAVVRQGAQAEKLKQEGLLELNEYVVSRVIREVTTSPRFLAYWPNSIERAIGNKFGEMGYGTSADLISLLFDVPEVRSALGLDSGLNEQDMLILHLWREICSASGFRNVTVHGCMSLETAKSFLSSLPISQVAQDLSTSLKDNSLLGLLNVSGLRTLLRHPLAQTNGYASRIAEIIKIALKG